MTGNGRPTRITVYGSRTCEDTAITTSRLAAWGVPFVDVDIDADASAADRVVGLVGHRVTPTVTVDGMDLVESEPTLETLGGIVRAAGVDVVAPTPRQFHGEVTSRSLPIRTLGTDGGGTFRLTALRGRRQAVLFFAHDAACLACFGYARQLAARREAANEADTDLVVVVRDEADAARGWRHGLDRAVRLVVDPDGTWTGAVTENLALPDDGAVVLVVDRFGAPRAGSAAPEAGGLMDPTETDAWARFIGLDCPECSGELPWVGPDDGPSARSGPLG